MAKASENIDSGSDYHIIANPWHRWGVIFGVYFLITLFFYGQALVSRSTSGREIAWFALFFDEFIYWLIWVAFTPLVLWFTRRFRFEKSSWKRSLAPHLILVLILAPLHEVLWRFLSLRLAYGIPFEAVGENVSMARILVGSFTGFYKYWLIVGIYSTFDYYRKYRSKEKAANRLQVQKSQLQSQLSEAQLLALKMQLHPHFLFNTLNTISILMNESVAKANRMLIRLSELLRITLDNPGEQMVPLQKELGFLERYLDIERIRFEDRLHVEVIVEPDVLDAFVPNLILQPLVENAIRHGIAEKTDIGHLVIRAHRQGSQLVIQIQDDGPGLNGNESNGQGIGLTNTAARLEQHFGADHQFKLTAAEGGGTLAHLVIPFLESPIDESAPDSTPAR